MQHRKSSYRLLLRYCFAYVDAQLLSQSKTPIHGTLETVPKSIGTAPMDVRWYYIDIGYACFAIKVMNGMVVDAPPIAKWMIYKNTFDIKNWFHYKKAKIKQI